MISRKALDSWMVRVGEEVEGGGGRWEEGGKRWREEGRGEKEDWIMMEVGGVEGGGIWRCVYVSDSQ